VRACVRACVRVRLRVYWGRRPRERNSGTGGRVEPLHIQKSSWPDLRAFLEMQHYIACERNDDGHVVRMSVTEHGANWLASKQAEAS
jgi:hypothetical protein